MKIIKLEEHDEIFPYILKLKNKLNYTFINIDAHSDLSMRRDKNNINIGNFISDLMFRKCFDEMIWIKNNKIQNCEFSDGNYNFFIGEAHNNHLKTTLPNIFFFSENSHEKIENLKNLKEINLYVRTLLENFQIKTKNNKWILSIDYDFFSCKNPYSKYLNSLLENINKDFLKNLVNKALKVQTKKEFEILKNEAICLNKEFVDNHQIYLLPEFDFEPEEIKNLIMNINNFIFKNFNLDNCLGIFLIKSITSGYTNKYKYDIIDKLIKENLLK